MEIEIKARVDDLNEIRKQLKKLKVKKVNFVHQIDEYYSLYKRPLTKVKAGDILRVRYNHGERVGRLEYHSIRNQYAAEEYEVSVGDIRELKKILHHMKARHEATVNKKREYYKKGRFIITLDYVKALGTFVEIELQGDDTKKNRRAIIDMFHQLGISDKQFCIDIKYGAEMIRRKGGKYAYF